MNRHSTGYGATPQEDLDEFVNRDTIYGTVRKAMLKRLNDLGLTEPKMCRNLLNNAVYAPEYMIDSFETGNRTMQELAGALQDIVASARKTKSTRLAKGTEQNPSAEPLFPKGAIEFYRDNYSTEMPSIQFKADNGATYSYDALDKAITSDIIIHGTEAAMQALGLSDTGPAATRPKTTVKTR